MKRNAKRMSAAAVADYLAAMPEEKRTRATTHGFGGLNFDVVVTVWNSRKVMARAIRMQQKREHKIGDFRACVPLTDGEGY